MWLNDGSCIRLRPQYANHVRRYDFVQERTHNGPPIRTLNIIDEYTWENGYVKSFNGKMRDELLARELFYSVKEAQVLLEMWRRQYNTIRPHSSLGYRPPVPAAFVGQPSPFQAVGLKLRVEQRLGACHRRNILGKRSKKEVRL